ncbi:MAG: type II secretion system protein [Bacilli bacterium]|nr:type II secretion system protein [Bacilli bacterium]
MKNNKGFTMIEVIAAVTLIGIISIIVFPQVFGVVERSRKKIYVEDATRLLAKAQFVMNSKSNEIVKPNDRGILILGLDFLDKDEFQNTPNGGEYLVDYTYVAVVNNAGKYYYSVMTVEKTKHGDYQGIELSSEEEVHSSKAANHVVTFTPNQLRYIADDATIISSSSKLDAAYIKNHLGAADSGSWSRSTTITNTYNKVD